MKARPATSALPRAAALPARPWLPWLAGGGAIALALYTVLRVHAAGQSLLALTLLVITALALWTYTSARTNALRYLFPGVATAALFVVFPMLYTVGIGFTNYSSQNLLDEAQARAFLLDEAAPAPDSARAFTLHPEGGRWRLRLAAAAGSEADRNSDSNTGNSAGTSTALLTPPLALAAPAEGAAAAPRRPVALAAESSAAPAPGLAPALPLREVVPLLPALRRLALNTPDGATLSLVSLREFAQMQPLYTAAADGTLAESATGKAYRPDAGNGFYTAADGSRLAPGYRVGVGLRHYATLFSEGKFREPFLGVFIWTVVFSGLSIVFAAGLGLLLSVLLNWDALPFKAAYRLVLFLPYAVPGFISILVFKGLFNQNLGEINFILNGLFGVRPAWFSDPLLAKTMLLVVNVWLGFPYMMILCSGLIQSIPADLYEASAVAGASPWANFRHITLPLILKPMTPLLISAFAFNFNNFVLVSLLTGGRPDQLDTTLPAGTTDILVSYTWRIAFQDSGQQFGLASAISTVIFLIVAAITVLQLRFTRRAEDERKH
jgi:maltose/maltodextrin transport system permease protein